MNQRDSSSYKNKNYFRILTFWENFSWFKRLGELWVICKTPERTRRLGPSGLTCQYKTFILNI